MKTLRRAGWVLWVLTLLPPLAVWGQLLPARIHKILIQNVGPPAVSEAYVRANIRSKEAQPLARATVDEDIKGLYATGYFYKIQVKEDNTAEGVDLTYVIQGKPILTDIKIVGNKKIKTTKLKKKLTSKIGQPLDERKLFNDAQAMKDVYQKGGYQKTTVTLLPPAIDEQAGRGVVTFEVHESPKVKIKDVVFVNATHFKQRPLRHVLKTRRRWMFSWLTGSGVVKEDQFEDDKDKLVEFYQNEGYIDFAITDIKFDSVNPKWIIIRIIVSEGRQYKVGTLDITGNHIFATNNFLKGQTIDDRLMKLQMTPGKIFKPAAFDADVQTLRDFYGSKGYLQRDPDGGTTSIVATRTPNAATGTMDIAYAIEEGDKDYIEKIEIKGNAKTKDRVIRRELAVFPGEVYDMVRIKISKERLEGLNYFEKVDTQPEDTDVPNHKNLIVGLEEKNTGNVTLGAGFNSIEGLVGMVELKQGNFDLFNPPTFTGGGQKFQIQASVGTLIQDYEVSFTEPWFLGKKLAFGVDLFHRYDFYDSLNSQYTETFDGGTLSLLRALTRHISGSISYTMENAHVAINSGYSTNSSTNYVAGPNGLYQPRSISGANLSTNIFDEHGTYLVSKFGLSLAYDTRNNVQLADRGQRTEFLAQVAAPPGNTDFYKLELRSDRFFKGFASNHIWEVGAQAGVTAPYGGSTQVPIFERWFLGGLYSLRGYRYHEVGPLDQYGEPLGGDTYYFGFVEYSIPIIKILRVAAFYDVGDVFPDAYSFRLGSRQQHYFTDDVGLGLRIVLPILGGVPLRLDYGIPITHDPDVGSSGRPQIGVGYQRQF